MSWFRFGRRKQNVKDGERERDTRLRVFGGRLFARGVPYVLPSDSDEVNRLDFQHYMLRHAL